MNVLAQLEFEFVYFEAAVNHFSHYWTGALHHFNLCIATGLGDWKLWIQNQLQTWRGMGYARLLLSNTRLMSSAPVNKPCYGTSEI